LREVLDLTLRDVGRRLDIRAQAVRAFEKAEATDRITLASLRRVAEAMGCELVYVLGPLDGSLQTLAEREARRLVAPDVEATAHSMQLEAPGSGDTEEKVRDEARRRLRGDS
jgi:predicted DNA-binding mobile mystery protein A